MWRCNLRILFIGCVKSSYILLKQIISVNANIVGVITMKKSVYNSDFVDITPLCISNHIPYIQIENVNSVESINFVHHTHPDIVYCFGWSQLIKEEFIKLIPQGIVGFHPAKLPNNRGRHPLIWALVLGLKETASTFFMIDKGIDTGDIVSQKNVVIDYEDNAQSLYDKVMLVAKEQIVELLRLFETNKVVRIKQNFNEGNVWRKRRKIDGQIDWRMSSQNIYNLIRALSKPYVGAHFIHDGLEIKVWKASEIKTNYYPNIEPGKVINVNKDGSIDIKTGDNLIRILEYDDVGIKIGEYL